MKRYISTFLVLCSVALCLCGCQKGELSSMPTTAAASPSTSATKPTSNPYYELYVRWVDDSFGYPTAAELIVASEMVFLGTVKSISFQILKDGKIVDPSDKDQKLSHGNLYTIYEIQANTWFKGDGRDTVYLAIAGGIENYREDEQRALLAEYELQNKIVLYESTMPTIKIGEDYLFTLKDCGWGDYRVRTAAYQFAFQTERSPHRGHRYYEEILAYFAESSEE